MSDYDEVDESAVEPSEEEGASALPPAEEPAQIMIEDGRDRTVSSREAERRRLEDDMKRFLSGGGKITQVDPNVRMDPPRKPESNYGSRPI